MNAVRRSFRRSFDGGYRFSMVLFFATMFTLAVINTSPGTPFHPWGDDRDGVPSPTFVVEPLRCTDTSC